MVAANCSEKSIQWAREQKRLADAANAKRSEAAKGNDNAKKLTENSPATNCGDTVIERNHEVETANKTATVKAMASGTDRGAVERVAI